MLNSVEFTKRLEKIMDYYQLNASAFADKLDIQRSSISHILSGRNKPSLDFVLKIYVAFEEISFDWLLFGKGSFPNLSYSETLHTTPSKPTENLNPIIESSVIPSPSVAVNSDVEKIVFFYYDGTFKEYASKQK